MRRLRGKWLCKLCSFNEVRQQLNRKGLSHGVKSETAFLLLENDESERFWIVLQGQQAKCNVGRRGSFAARIVEKRWITSFLRF
jgi:hypothetical protein